VRQGLRALYASWKQGKLVRVFRSSNLGNHFQASSSKKNHQLFRYDGLYKVTHVWDDKGEKDPAVLPKQKLPLEYTFLLERSCGDGNLTETDFFAECKRRGSMPAFLEHTINWTERSKAPATLPPIQPKVVPSSVTQVSTSEATTPESVPLPAVAPPADDKMAPPKPADAVAVASTVRQVSMSSEPTTPGPIPPLPSLGKKWTLRMMEEEKCRIQGTPMLEDGKGVTKETKRKRGKKAAEARDKTAKKQRGGGADSDNDNVFKPDDENETVASRNPLQRNSEFHPAKEDKSDGGRGADKENDAQVQATPTRLQDYSKERNMVTPDEKRKTRPPTMGEVLITTRPPR
jgi:hypothetical protein